MATHDGRKLLPQPMALVNGNGPGRRISSFLAYIHIYISIVGLSVAISCDGIPDGDACFNYAFFRWRKLGKRTVVRPDTRAGR